MNWRAVVAGMTMAAEMGWGLGASAQAQQIPVGSAWVSAPSAAAPGAQAEFPLPPHLTGGFARPLPAAAGAMLPTLQDLMQISPTHVAPPPPHHSRRSRTGGSH